MKQGNRMRRGMVLLEVMLAFAIIATVFAGFALSLQKCLEAAKINREETRLRSALQSRLAEMCAEPVSGGKRVYYYFDNEVTVEEEITPAGLQNAQGARLAGLFRAVLVAKTARSGAHALQTETMRYVP